MHGAAARPIAVRSLVATAVSGRAQSVMPAALWKRYVAGYVGGDVVPYVGEGVPTLEDCRTARAELLVYAPFDLRSQLPGLANATGDRVAASAHIVAQNCLTGETVYDRIVAFASDPPGDENAGDFEVDPESAWGHEIPATLARVRFNGNNLARVAPPAFAPQVAEAPAPAGQPLTAAALRATPPPRAAPPRRAPPPASVPPAASPSTPSPSTPSPPTAPPPTASPHPPSIVDIAARPYVAATARPQQPRRIADVGTSARPPNVGPAEGVSQLSQSVTVARILSVRPPFAIVDLRNSNVAAGDTLVDFADGDRNRLPSPIALTVTQNFGSYVEAVFDGVSGGALPSKGDLVEAK